MQMLTLPAIWVRTLRLSRRLRNGLNCCGEPKGQLSEVIAVDRC